MSHSSRHRGLRPTLRIAAVLLLATGCGSWQREGDIRDVTPEQSLMQLFNPAGVYQGLGRLVSTSEVPFVGTVVYLPGPGTSTRVLIGLSAANRAFSFDRQGDVYQANYRVEYTLTRSGQAPARAARDASIKVASLQEALRIDESVILQQAMVVEPGPHQLTVRISDKGSNRSGVVVQSLTVPSFTPGSVTAPILAYSVTGRATRSDSIDLVLNPRGAVAYGGDTLLIYIEGVQMPGPTSIPFEVRDGRDSVVLRTTVDFTGGSEIEGRIVRIKPDSAPLGRIDFLLGQDGSRGKTAGVVSFSGNWIITNFDDLISLLRYFGEGHRLEQMKEASPQARPELWREFYAATDPNRQTPENEALDAYFARLGQANAQFSDEGIPGWRTDRGEVFVVLGPPDEKFDSTPTQQGRFVRWGYFDLRLSLIFQDVTGFGRYRMTTESRSEFERVKGRVQRAAER
ncbi:MAG TPA: GWxTD domain-containing protein [Gemmatimonadales bacterium]|nr:GWxTD domain-containing protein [Gemmatimonadales bacterium]